MPYDKKTGKHYDYTKEGISQYKKDTGKGMPYAPFKMSGHTLPGPNQSSALKISRAHSGKEIEERTRLEGGTGGFWDVGSGANINAKLIQRMKGAEQGTPVGSSIEGNEPPQSYVDTGMDDSGTDTLATEGDTAKKKVDVEVSVTDKKV